MLRLKRDWLAPAVLVCVTCFSVFVLPFLLPPGPLQGISAANVAGFNNKVAAVALALISVLAAAWFYQQRAASDGGAQDFRPLPRRLVVGAVALICGFLAAITILIARSEYLFRDDLDYFVNRLTNHTHFGRVLYDGIEFPYGPLLFYLPLLMQKLLFPLHLSLRAAYLVGLNGLYVLGILLLAYILNALRMLRSSKILLFAGLAPQTIQTNLGYNYSLFRFLVVPACLIFANRMQVAWQVALGLAAGQVLCFSTSPEMGFAFLAGSAAYVAYRVYLARSLRPALLFFSPLASSALFFAVSIWLSGTGCLRMLGMFSRGVYNLVVEPLPYILIFLVAVAGLAPWGLAKELRTRSLEAPIYAALYVASLALLPVAFGRCDPEHVLFNGFGFLVLSFVAISAFSRRQRIAWSVAAGMFFLFNLLLTGRGGLFPIKVNLVSAFQRTPFLDRPFTALAPHSGMGWSKLMLAPRHPETLDTAKLRSLTGGEPIVTPVTTSRVVQEELLQAGLLVPTFYYFQVAVIDRNAELREIAEFNQSKWSLIPPDVPVELTEHLEKQPFGFQFTYPAKRTPYVTGLLFQHNLRQNWRPVQTLGEYVLYQRL